MRRVLTSIILFVSLFSLSASDIYSIRFDSSGNPRPGTYYMTVNGWQNEALQLAESLGWSDSVIRNGDDISYVSSGEGEGQLPILAFHKLGYHSHMELTPERFEELLLFLAEEKFHIISDFQFLDRDFTYVKNGYKPIVLGSDDGAAGVFYYETTGDIKYSPFRMVRGDYVIADRSMVYYLNKYLPLEEGRRNFTFYLAFDALPFRQTGGGYNPGSPYLGIPSVKSKLDYLSDHYYIGNHTLNHLYSEDLDEETFVEELTGYYDVLTSYGIAIGSEDIVAYSFGIGELTARRFRTMSSFSYEGTRIPAAYDYNGLFPIAIDSYVANPYDISRTGVENRNFDAVISRLKENDLFINQRAVLVKTEDYPLDLSHFDLDRDDMNFILIGK